MQIKHSCKLVRDAMLAGDEPFGAVLVKSGKIVAEGRNGIHSHSHPTYHAELGLIR